MENKNILPTDTGHELENCTFVKTVLMIIIVLFHSIVFWRNDWFPQIGAPVFASPVMRGMALWLSSFHTHTFTLVSGYIYYHIKFEKRRYDNKKLFLKNKAKRLLIPYVFVSAVWVAPIYALFSKSSLSELLHKYLLGESPSQLWFLLMLFNVFWIIDLLSPYIYRDLRTGIVIILLLDVAGVVGDHFLPNYFQIFTAFKYSTYFYVGTLFRKYNLRSRINLKSIAAGVVVNTVLLWVHTFYADNRENLINKLIYTSVGFLLYASGSVICFCLLQKLADKINYIHSKWFGVLSKNSMGIYLFHEQMIYFCLFCLNGVVEPHINAGINFIVSFTLSFAITAVMMKFKYTRFLIGEK